MNLLDETKGQLNAINKNHNDIVFIGSAESGHCCTWQEFCELADREYDNGFGVQEVAGDLVIIFSDKSFLEREEYDGAENWRHVTTLTRAAISEPIKTLFCTDKAMCYCNS
jgi:hypothetical protein